MDDLTSEIAALDRIRRAEKLVSGAWDCFASCHATDYTYMHRGALVDRYSRRRWRALNMESQARFCEDRAGTLVDPRHPTCGEDGERLFSDNAVPRDPTSLDILEHVCARLALNTPAHVVLMDGQRKRAAQPPILTLARRHGNAWHEGMIDV
jgi:hypothetical protein